MSRHSHWAKIKRAKGADDAKKGAAFTKLSRAITIAAKEKGIDPSTNFKLRLAIDAARAVNMPKDTIDRAVARAAGGAGEGALEEAVYEVMGPGGVAIVIDAVTDNKNRTSGNIKTILSRQGGNLTATKWQFDQKGVIHISSDSGDQNKISDELELELIDAGAADVQREDNRGSTSVQPEVEPPHIVIYTEPTNLQKVIDFLISKNIKPDHSGIEWIPKNTITITDPSVREALDKFYDALDADEDVRDFATNET